MAFVSTTNLTRKHVYRIPFCHIIWHASENRHIDENLYFVLSVDPTLPKEKQEAMAKKDMATTTVSLGIRICGVRVRRRRPITFSSFFAR
jgi:hypothetical protein